LIPLFASLSFSFSLSPFLGGCAARRSDASAVGAQAVTEMGARFEGLETALAEAGWNIESLDLVTLGTASQSWVARWQPT
jgi:hypothetical protein